jgi:soluble cytochrome b562
LLLHEEEKRGDMPGSPGTIQLSPSSSPRGSISTKKNPFERIKVSILGKKCLDAEEEGAATAAAAAATQEPSSTESFINRKKPTKKTWSEIWKLKRQKYFNLVPYQPISSSPSIEDQTTVTSAEVSPSVCHVTPSTMKDIEEGKGEEGKGEEGKGEEEKEDKIALLIPSESEKIIEGPPSTQETPYLNSKEQEVQELVTHCDDILQQLTDNTNEFEKRIKSMHQSFDISMSACEMSNETLKQHIHHALEEIEVTTHEITDYQEVFDRMGEKLDQTHERLENLGDRINQWYDRVGVLSQDMRLLQWTMKRSRLKDSFYLVLSWILLFVTLMVWFCMMTYVAVRKMLFSMVPSSLSTTRDDSSAYRRIKRLSSPLHPEEWAKRIRHYFEKEHSIISRRDRLRGTFSIQPLLRRKPPH